MARLDPLEEAFDPSTDPERLRELARHQAATVHQAVWRNPSLPEDVWREALMEGEPEAWANPMAPIYLLAWTPQDEDSSTLEQVARSATYALWREPERCSPEGNALIAAKVQEGWATSKYARDMIRFLGRWAKAKDNDSSEHREVVRIVVLCVRTTPDITAEDRHGLNLLEAWSAGSENRRNEAEALASCEVVKSACWFALDVWYTPWNAIHEVLQAVEGAAGKSAKAEHERRLADLIRREMPLPPVVE